MSQTRVLGNNIRYQHLCLNDFSRSRRVFGQYELRHPVPESLMEILKANPR